MKPLTIRNAAAIAGAAKASPKSLRNRAPTMTAGMVARTTKKNVRLSVFARASGALIKERRKLNQSRQKKEKSTLQLPGDLPTGKASQSGAFRSIPQFRS